MTKFRLCHFGRVATAAGLIAFAGNPGTAAAQWGMGMGWGWGGFGAMPSASTNLLNDHAVARTGAAAARKPGRSHSPYGNNPNSYFNRIRDNGFVSHSDVRRRRPPTYRREPTASLGGDAPAEPRPAAAAVPPTAIVPLGSFFDASLRLIWPHEAPIAGDLKRKRDVSDEASVAVLNETRAQGRASISGVADARQKLIDYGQPALQEIRAQSTPPIADAFHRFLLSLYDSLTDAASASQPVR